MANIPTREIVLAKIDQEKSLTREEEMFYLTSIINLSEDDANRITAISENKDKNLIID